jgi:hypothetical protein
MSTQNNTQIECCVRENLGGKIRNIYEVGRAHTLGTFPPFVFTFRFLHSF